MRITNSVALATVAALLAAAPAAAQTGMKNGSANVNTTKAVCSPGDPNVLVDVKAKTYTMDAAANKAAANAKTGKAMAGANGAAAGNAAASGTTAESGSSADASGTAADNTGGALAMKSMCKSEADSMGAKMAPGSMQKKSM